LLGALGSARNGRLTDQDDGDEEERDDSEDAGCQMLVPARQGYQPLRQLDPSFGDGLFQPRLNSALLVELGGAAIDGGAS